MADVEVVECAAYSDGLVDFDWPVVCIRGYCASRVDHGRARRESMNWWCYGALSGLPSCDESLEMCFCRLTLDGVDCLVWPRC